MAHLTIYKDEDLNSTVVANRFIDEYMEDANDAQIKVYLYLLRMMNAHQATSVSEIADKFNHTEKNIVRALKYWEKLGLLELDHADNTENSPIIGIHIVDLEHPSAGNRKKQPASTFVPMPASASAEESREPSPPAAGTRCRLREACLLCRPAPGVQGPPGYRPAALYCGILYRKAPDPLGDEDHPLLYGCAPFL